ncbi:MAG: hypothetical protein HYV07_09120 [Deltaproteobacteria bacterium]|nr:hypothetical protein [Deltaproteobacteria bacterium]
MGHRLQFKVRWLEAPEGEAFGPEVDTWGSVALLVDGTPITVNTQNVTFLDAEAPAHSEVTGPLCGLAEWLVDNFASIFWDCPVPFRKTMPEGRTTIPGLLEASKWWTRATDLASMGTWQARHTLGLTCSQLALPSIVFVPEVQRVGLFVGPAAANLGPTISFQKPAQSEYWLDRTQLESEIVEFVDGVLSRADGTQWGAWLSGRWREVRAMEADPASRLRLRFGELVAATWNEYDDSLRSALEGFLVQLVTEQRQLDHQGERTDDRRAVLDATA